MQDHPFAGPCSGRKILVVMTNPFPGSSATANHMARLASGLRHCGHEVLIVAPCGPGERGPRAGVDADGNRFQSFPMPARRSAVPFYPHWTAALRPRLRETLRQILEDERWDVAIFHGGSWWALDPARKICQAHGVRVVPYAVECFPPSVRRVLGLSWFDQCLLHTLTHPQCDGLIGISRFWSEVAGKHGLPFVRIPAFSPHDDDELPPVVHAPRKSFKLVFSGIWVKRELPRTLIRGVELAVGRGLDIEMVAIGAIGGRFEEKRALRYLASSHARDRIRLLGWVSDEVLHHETSTADALVLLRRDDRENRALFPTRLPEHLATGKPLIISNAGDLALYLRHLHSAYVVQPGERPEALADAIEFLAKNPQAAAAIGLGGRAALLKSFSQRELGERLGRFLESLLAPATAAANPESSLELVRA